MSAQPIFCLHNPALLMALAAVFPGFSYAAGEARVDFSVGNVTAVNLAGVQRPLIKGAEIGNGDTVRTGDGGRAQVRFSDGAMVSLQPETEFRIDNYQFSGKADGQEKGFFSLLKGGLRTITGWVGRTNRDNYKVSTVVATIGIRGTEFTAGLNPAGEELLVHTGEGLIEVCNAAGCLLLASGETGVIGGQNVQPRRTENRPQLPPSQPTNTATPVFSSGNVFSNLSVPTSPMPTSGTATYSTLLSASSVTESTGVWAPGTLNKAKIEANFGALTVSTNLQGTINSQSFDVSSTVLGTISGNSLSANFSGNTGLCAGSGCSGSVSGKFYGTDAERAKFDYTINAPTKTLTGSAVLGK